MVVPGLGPRVAPVSVRARLFRRDLLRHDVPRLVIQSLVVYAVAIPTLRFLFLLLEGGPIDGRAFAGSIGTDWPMLVVGFLFVVLCLLVLSWWRAAKTIPDRQGVATQWRFDEQGVAIESASGRREFPWSGVGKLRETRSCFILVMFPVRILLPKRDVAAAIPLVDFRSKIWAPAAEWARKHPASA